MSHCMSRALKSVRVTLHEHILFKEAKSLKKVIGVKTKKAINFLSQGCIHHAFLLFSSSISSVLENNFIPKIVAVRLLSCIKKNAHEMKNSTW